MRICGISQPRIDHKNLSFRRSDRKGRVTKLTSAKMIECFFIDFFSLIPRTLTTALLTYQARVCFELSPHLFATNTSRHRLAMGARPQRVEQFPGGWLKTQRASGPDHRTEKRQCH